MGRLLLNIPVSHETLTFSLWAEARSTQEERTERSGSESGGSGAWGGRALALWTPLILIEDTWSVFGLFMPSGTHFDFWLSTLALAGVKVGAVCRLEGLTLTPFASAHSRRNAGGMLRPLQHSSGGWPSAERRPLPFLSAVLIAAGCVWPRY